METSEEGGAGNNEDKDHERERFPVILMLPDGRVVVITDAEGMVIASFL